MAQDNEVALQIKTPDLATPLQAATNYATGQSNLQTAQQNRDIDQTKLTMLNRVNQGEDIQFQNQLIRDAAQKGSIGGPAAFDAAMQDAYDRGAKGAAQFIGRYTDLLPSRIMAAYGAPPPTAAAPTSGLTAGASPGQLAGGLGVDDLDRRFQNVPPERMAGILTKLNLISDALTGVGDQATWQAALHKLQAAGINTGQYAGAPHSSMLVQQAYANIQPVRQYLQNRLTASNTGVPDPLIKRTIEKTPEGLYEYDPYGRPGTPANPIATKKEFIGVDKTGSLSAGVFDPATGTFTDVNGTPGVSPFAAFAAKMNHAENDTGNPTAKNQLSSATGNGQFINSTWLDLVKSTRPSLVKDMSDSQILALRNDPKLSGEMTAAYAQNNAATFSSEGLPVTTATLALAHRFGPNDAKAILTAAPGTQLSDILSKKVMDANPALARMTAGQYAQSMASQFGNTPLDTSTPNNDEHGDDYLKTLQPTMAAMVKSYADGRQAFPSGFALKSPYFQNLIRMVGQYDPNFDAVNYNARAKTRSDFTSGKSSQTINAMNTALGHLNMLDTAGDALNNRDIPAWNYIANTMGTAFGKEAPGNYKAAAGLVAEELTRVYRQAGGAEADIERHLADLSVNASPAQRRGALYTIGELLKSKLDAMGEQYSQGMGTTQDPLRLLNAPAQASFNKLLSYGPKGTGKSSAASTVAGTIVRPDSGFVNGRTYQDQSGSKAVYQDGKWIPVAAGVPNG